MTAPSSVTRYPTLTGPTRCVLRALLAVPGVELYGRQICADTGLARGTVHPILGRLERAGWLSSRWEEIDPHIEQRPRRHYYALTAAGEIVAREVA